MGNHYQKSFAFFLVKKGRFSIFFVFHRSLSRQAEREGSKTETRLYGSCSNSSCSQRKRFVGKKKTKF